MSLEDDMKSRKQLTGPEELIAPEGLAIKIFKCIDANQAVVQAEWNGPDSDDFTLSKTYDKVAANGIPMYHGDEERGQYSKIYVESGVVQVFLDNKPI